MESPDGEVYSALEGFASSELDGSWSGQREREAVSLFAFGTLLDEVSSRGLLQDSRQIGIEMAIPQVTLPGEDSSRKKSQVCKDVVLWPKPKMTCWDEDGAPTRLPAAVIEWKYGDSEIFEGDVNWLKAFTDQYSTCVGYAVTANQSVSPFTLSCTRVADGNTEPEWLQVS